MTRPSDPGHPAPPTVREIAALTALLRDISARGRDVDPVERAVFLADKDALLARITASYQHEDDATGAVVEEGGTRSITQPWPVMSADGDIVEGGPVDGPWWDDRAAAFPDIRDDGASPAPAFLPREGAAQDRRGSARISGSEQERREQLIRWHAEEDLTDGFNDGCTCGDLARGDQ